MKRSVVARLVALGCLGVILGACAAAPPKPETAAPPPAPAAPIRPGGARPAPAQGVVRREPPAPAPLPKVFESEDFVVVLATTGDTPESLAARFLGDPAKSWMIEDYNGTTAPAPGQEVVIPKRSWNPSGVEPGGYQLVPVLVYHNLAPQAKGRLVLSVKAFEEQMRYLKAQGYRVIGVKEFLEFTTLDRQLPHKSVVLTFDDGWKSFKEYAHPILRELGFTATLFIYTDFVGGRTALTWGEIKELAQEGFDVEAHSKTHGDFRRKAGESDDEYAKRMQAELVQPLALFQRHLGRGSQILAYPYGSQDEEVVKRAKEAGYMAAFTVRREGNASFTPRLTIHRSQVYSEMTLEDFAKNLNTFNQEPIK